MTWTSAARDDALHVGLHTNCATEGLELVFRDAAGTELGRDTIPFATHALLRELRQDHLPTGLLLGKPARGLCNFEYTRSSLAGRRDGPALHLIWRDEHGRLLAEDDLTGVERAALIAWLERAAATVAIVT